MPPAKPRRLDGEHPSGVRLDDGVEINTPIAQKGRPEWFLRLMLSGARSVILLDCKVILRDPHLGSHVTPRSKRSRASIGTVIPDKL